MLSNMTHIRSIGASALAFITCPCHLPITLPVMLSLTTGTGLGVWLANHQVTITATTTVIFGISLFIALRWAQIPLDEIQMPPAVGGEGTTRS